MPPTLDDLDLVTSWVSDDAVALLGEVRAALVQRGGRTSEKASAELDEAEAKWKRGEEAPLPLFVDFEAWNSAWRQLEDGEMESGLERESLSLQLGITVDRLPSASQALLGRVLLLQHHAFPGRQRALRWMWEQLDLRLKGTPPAAAPGRWLLFIVWPATTQELRGQSHLLKLKEALELHRCIVDPDENPELSDAEQKILQRYCAEMARTHGCLPEPKSELAGAWPRIDMDTGFVPPLAAAVGRPARPLVDFLAPQRALILEGAPGAGKTTFVHWLAHRLAGSARPDAPEPGLVPVVLPLSAVAGSSGGNIPPIVQWLRTYQPAEQSASDWKAPQVELLRESFIKLLSLQRLCLLLEDFDAVADESREAASSPARRPADPRQKIVVRLREFADIWLREAASPGPAGAWPTSGNRLIVTMRAGTSISLGDALHLHLEPLSKAAGLQLLQRVLAKLRFAGGHPPSPGLAPALLQSAGASPLSAGLLSVLALHAARAGGASGKPWLAAALEDFSRQGDRPEAVAPPVAHRRQAIPAGMRAALFSILFTAVFATLLPAIFRETPWGRRAESATYGRFFAGAQPASSGGARPKIWIVDIASIDPEGSPPVTSRTELLKLVQSIAAKSPSAIGLDLNLAPGHGATSLTAGDRALLEECLALTQRPPESRIRVALAIDTRTQYGPPAQWLGEERYAPLAATSICPFPAEWQTRPEDPPRLDVTDQWTLPLEHPAMPGERALPGLAAALVPAARLSRWREPREKGVPLLPAPVADLLPGALRKLITIPPEGLYALTATTPMPEKEKPQPPRVRHETREALEEPPHDPLWTLDSYLVSYHALESFTALAPDEVSAHPSLQGSVVLLGDASSNPNARDIFSRLPISNFVPGVLCHACGVSTLWEEPIWRLETRPANWLNGLSAALAILAGEILGFTFWRLQRKSAVRTWWYLLCIRSLALGLVCGLAVSLWEQQVAWTEFIWVAGSILVLIVLSTVWMAAAHQKKLAH